MSKTDFFMNSLSISVKERIIENISNTCVSCLLEIPDIGHTCQLNWSSIVLEFDRCFSQNNEKLESWRLCVLASILFDTVQNELEVKRHVLNYIHHRKYIKQNKENYLPLFFNHGRFFQPL